MVKKFSFNWTFPIIASIIFVLIFSNIPLSEALTPNPRFDQLDTVIIEHSSWITYNATNAPNTIDVEIVTPHESPLTLTLTKYEPDKLRSVVHFTEGSSDRGNSILHVNNTDVILLRLIGESVSDHITIKPQNNVTQTFGVSTINYDPKNCVTNDVEEDGVCDSWEINPQELIIDYPLSMSNYTYTCTSTPCSGIDKRDIYVEVDYMEGHRPNEDALNEIVKAFEDAPFTGNQQIRVHFQIDDADSVNIPHSTETYWPGYNQPTPWIPDKKGFDQIKANYFGTPTERTDHSKWFDSPGVPGDGWHQKQQAFHYVLFVHDNKDDPGSSGSAEVHGDDIMISLGAFDGQIGLPSQQSGSLMHELGHNLKLNHGGAWNDTENCKPNYLSVMSYTKQFKDLDTTRPLTFSEYGENDITKLDENGNLNEILGIDPLVPEWKVIYGANASSHYPPINPPIIGPLIDWDQISYTTSPNVTEDVNWIMDPTTGVVICPQSGLSILKSYDDWENIDLNSKGNGNWASGKIKSSNHIPIEFEQNDVYVQPKTTFVALEYDNTKKDLDSIDKYLKNELEIFNKEINYNMQFSQSEKQVQIDPEDTLNDILDLLESTCIPIKLTTHLPSDIRQNLRICIDSSDEINVEQVTGMRVIRILALEDQIIKSLQDEHITSDEYDKHFIFYKEELKSIRDDIRDNNMVSAMQRLSIVQSTYDGKDNDDRIKDYEHQIELLKGTDDILLSYTYIVPEFGVFTTLVLVTSIALILSLSLKFNLSRKINF